MSNFYDEELSRIANMNFKISGNLIFDNNPEFKIVWHIRHIKNNEEEWNLLQRRSLKAARKWLLENYPELMI